MKKVFITVGAVLTAAGLALLAWAFAVAGFDFSKLGTAKYETNIHTPQAAFENIDINVSQADIFLAPSADGKCSVVCAETDKVRHSAAVENGTLKIRSSDRRVWYEHIAFFTKPISVTVYLPEARYSSLSISCGTGDVSLPAGFSFGALQIETSTGDVVCEASAEGSVWVKTSTGDVRLAGMHAKSIDFIASTGDLNVEKIKCEGAFSVALSTGKTRMTDVICSDLRVKASTGDVTISNTVAEDSLEIETSTGEVRFENSDAGKITVKTSTGDVKGSLRTEKVFITETSAGKLRVPGTSSGGICRITTSTGDVEISIAGR